MPFVPVGISSRDAASAALPPAVVTARRAWEQVGGVLVALLALALQLPGPAATLDTLVRNKQLTGQVGNDAMLCLAATVVWLLLGWVMLVSAAAAASRLPGVIGSAAAAGLGALAPIAVRNVLLTVVGASVVTGLAGCSTAAPAAAAVVPATAVVPASAPAAQHRAAAVGTASGGQAASAVGPAGVVIPAAVDQAPAHYTPAAQRHAAAPGPTSQRLAERLIGVATLRISDRIAVEGSAVGAGSAAPSPGWAAQAAPDIDWPAAHQQEPPRTPTTTATTPTAPRAPTVDVDWPGPPARAATPGADGSVVVVRGDSLWTIAARSLPAAADDAQIDQTWRAWYAANSAVIGSDPNYLLPGQILQPPTPEVGTSS